MAYHVRTGCQQDVMCMHHRDKKTVGLAIRGIYSAPSRACAGCLQIQPNKFPGDFQDTFNKFPVDIFTLIEPPQYYNYMHKNWHRRRTPKSKNKFVGVQH